MSSFLQMRDRVFEAVPIGAQNAKSSREIWRALGIGAESTCSEYLNTLADVDRIQRGKRPQHGGVGFAYVYWREA